MMLEKIVINRKQILEQEKKSVSLTDIRKKSDILIASGYSPSPFYKNINESPFLIAEIKKSSPSRGIIREDFIINDIVSAYKNSNHVNAISVLTEPSFFSGNYEYLRITKETAEKPVLMKDFIFDEYQIYRGFSEGASAILLIAAILSETEAEKLSQTAANLGMGVLFETHTGEEFRRAVDTGFTLIGINNRDLKTFVTDIKTTIKILDSEGKPNGYSIITESGIHTKEDVDMLFKSGADGFLIGERFMKQKDIEYAINELFG